MANPPLTLLRISVLAALAWLVPSHVSAQSAQALPIEVPAASFLSEQDLLVYTVDLGTLPERAGLRVVVTPDAAHPDLETEIEITNWVGGFGFAGFDCPLNTTSVSSIATGENQLEDASHFINCDPRTNMSPFNWTGKTVDVRVRVTDFGQAGPGADANILIRGVTKVPTRNLLTEVETDLSPQTAIFEPNRDTVLYENNSATSNGAGSYLWAGMDYLFIFDVSFRWRRHSLLAFPLLGSTSPIPFNADVLNADLRLYAFEVLNGGGGVTLYETGSDPSGAIWTEGNANGDGTEFFGVEATGFAATWSHRQRSSGSEFYPWVTPGGDQAGLQLATMNINSTGYKTFSSLALDNAVQGMLDRGNANDGFLLKGPYSLFLFEDRGVRFGSRSYGSSTLRPRLTVDYQPTSPYDDGNMSTGVVSFIGEGENFRWIYDLDQDDILLTSIGGVCDATEWMSANSIPYTYEYMGPPGYVGLDCCAWQVESMATGTVGAGQALFFHNLDPLDPANLPPDTDGDGIFDPCDNCPTIPNGPALGSCVGASGVMGTCLAQQDCAPGFTCQFAQQDADLDFAGDVCSVPEPGFGLGIATAAGLLLGLRGRRGNVKRFTVTRGESI